MFISRTPATTRYIAYKTLHNVTVASSTEFNESTSAIPSKDQKRCFAVNHQLKRVRNKKDLNFRQTYFLKKSYFGLKLDQYEQIF